MHNNDHFQYAEDLKVMRDGKPGTYLESQYSISLNALGYLGEITWIVLHLHQNQQLFCEHLRGMYQRSMRCYSSEVNEEYRRRDGDY